MVRQHGAQTALPVAQVAGLVERRIEGVHGGIDRCCERCVLVVMVVVD